MPGTGSECSCLARKSKNCLPRVSPKTLEFFGKPEGDTLSWHIGTNRKEQSAIPPRRDTPGFPGAISMKAHRILLTLVALVLALSLPGLVVEPAQAQTVSGGFLRVTHASVGAPNVDVYLGGAEEPAIANLAFGNSTDLIELNAGNYTVSVRPAGGAAKDTLLRATVNIPRRGVAEVVALGTAGVLSGSNAFRLGRYPLDLTKLTDKARVYVVHAASGVGAVDVLAGDQVLFRNLRFSEGTLRPVDVDPGVYDLKVVPAGATEPVAIDLAGKQLNAGQVYTIVAAGATGETPLILSGYGLRAAPTAKAPTGYVRVTHASSGAPNVDIYLDGARTAAISDLAYGASTDFLALPAKEYAFAIRPAGARANSAPAFEGTFTLGNGASLELVALGVLGGEPAFDVKAYPVKRNATGGKARVYVVHASPSTPSVDVKVNGKVTLDKFGFASFTETPLEVDPGSINVTGVASGTASPVLISLVGLEVKADTVYTVVARGDLKKETPLLLESASISDADAGLSGWVRVTHAAAGAPSVDVYVDGSPVATLENLGVGQSSAWLKLPATKHTVSLRKTGLSPVNPVFYEETIDVPADASVEVLAVGKTSGDPRFELQSFEVDRSFPDGKARVFVVHAAPDTGPVDVRVNGKIAVTALPYGDSSEPLSVDAGLLNAAVVGTGKSSPVLAALAQVELAANTVYTVIAYGSPINYQPLVLTSTFPANVRIVHASPGAPAVDVYLDDATTPAVTNLEFGKATDLISLEPKEYKVAIRATGSAANSAPAFETTLTVTSGGSAEVVALGVLGGEPAFTLGVFPVNDSATNGKVRVYAIHAAPKAPAVDVYVNGKNVVPGLEFPKYTATALEVDPGLFNIAVTPAGQRSPVVTQLTQVELNADTIYTVIAYGDPVAGNPLVLTRSPR